MPIQHLVLMNSAVKYTLEMMLQYDKVTGEYGAKYQCAKYQCGKMFW